MKRDIRKNNKEEMSMKIIKYSAITVAILTVIVFGVLIYSKKLNDTVKEGTLLGEQISTQNENTESASTEIGKSINESEKELKAQNNMVNNTVNNMTTNSMNSNSTNSKNTETTNNMVLGISESLPDNRKNTDLRFIAFKKYYQRIYKKNGNRYLSWLKELETNIEKTTETNSKLKEHNKSLFNDTNSITLNQRSQMCELLEIPQYKLYIWGHSLDSTDGDVIKKFLCCDNIITTIYYLNNDLDLKEKISNLVRIIGQEELISRTGNLQTIRFEPIPE